MERVYEAGIFPAYLPVQEVLAIACGQPPSRRPEADLRLAHDVQPTVAGMPSLRDGTTETKTVTIGSTKRMNGETDYMQCDFLGRVSDISLNAQRRNPVAQAREKRNSHVR